MGQAPDGHGPDAGREEGQKVSTADSEERDDMAHTVAADDARSDNGHLGTVDECLAREHGGRPSTGHGRRYGHAAVNVHASHIIRAWRQCGDLAELAAWLAPIEAALAHRPSAEGSARLRAALADEDEDRLEALYVANPCAETARALLRQRAVDRGASLDHDREIASRHGLTL